MASNIVLQLNFLKSLTIDFEEFSKKSQEVSPHYAISKAAELEYEFAAARDRHNKIVVVKNSTEATKYCDDDVFRRIRESYHQLWAALHNVIPASTSSTGTQETSNLNTTLSSQCNSYELKLPKIDIPTFNGDYNEWMSFNNLFTTIVHNSTALEPIHKLQYLRNSLRGEALNIIKNLDLDNDNYYEARRLLKARFQHTRRLVDSYFERIFKAHSIPSETSKAIKNLIDTIQDCRTSLKKLNAVIPDYVIVYHIVDILPAETLGEWGEALGGSTDLPSVDFFLAFLEKRFRIVEMTETIARSYKKPGTYHVQSESSSTESDEVSCDGDNRSNRSAQHISVKCNICDCDHHFTKCDGYNRMSQEERLDFIKGRLLCINCLKTSHTVGQCKSHFRCRVCKRKHHTSLHRYEISFSNKQSSGHKSPKELEYDSRAESVQPNVNRTYQVQTQNTSKLLGTASVIAFSGSGSPVILRSLVDPCSTDNYITESMVHMLHLQKFHDPTVVLTMGNQQTNHCTHRVNLRIKSRKGNFSTDISAAIVDKITTDMPTTEIPLSSAGYLANLPLADPFFNRPSSINLLLGVDVHTSIKIDESKRLGNFIAENTLFGYLIRGSVATNIASRNSIVLLTQNVPRNLQLQGQRKTLNSQRNISEYGKANSSNQAQVFKYSIRSSNNNHTSKSENISGDLCEENMVIYNQALRKMINELSQAPEDLSPKKVIDDQVFSQKQNEKSYLSYSSALRQVIKIATFSLQFLAKALPDLTNCFLLSANETFPFAEKKVSARLVEIKS